MGTLVVNHIRRHACMRAHTATHLLHAELAKIFPMTKQAWSYVGEDELRFDFFAERSLTPEEIEQINLALANSIAASSPVSTQEMPYADAVSFGAKAFFEDSYPEIVRVVEVRQLDSQTVGQSNSPAHQNPQMLSIELCGGTHVSSTDAIGCFVITEQSAVAAGVKRITALTGPRVLWHVTSLQSTIDEIAAKVSVPAKQIVSKIDKILVDQADMQTKLQTMMTLSLQQKEKKEMKVNNEVLSFVRQLESDPLLSGMAFSDIVTTLRGLSDLGSWMVSSTTGQYALSNPRAKEIVAAWWRSGGGSPTFVQGKEEKVLMIS